MDFLKTFIWDMVARILDYTILSISKKEARDIGFNKKGERFIFR